ncbi:nucleotidyltransferase family protein [Yoonia sp. 208BN28-4]|uniref:nucleotidyltransferase family protein n=1 Tax=Yoonia sp. 208BN28-4 TaxID=3126505 RepID=UPI0030AA9A9D
MPLIDRHSATAHAAWHDLLRSLLDEEISELRGTPTKVTRGGRGYWYDSYRVGTQVKKRYIGEDTPALAARLSNAAAIKSATAERAGNRTRLIRILRAEGFMGVDAATGSLMSAMAQAGVFRLGGTVVGTHAFRLYEGVLGLKYRFDDMAQTGDIDIASFERLSLALEDTVSPPLTQVLSDFAFDPLPSLHNKSTWRWRQTRNDLLVEFLTPSFDAEEGLRPLAALGVDAQALHHLNYLLRDPIPAVVPYRSGVLVQIPPPDRFAIHKLIVASRRKGRLQARKDRAQAAFLITALAEDRPDELKDAYVAARAEGPKWRDRLDETLHQMPTEKRLLDGL